MYMAELTGVKRTATGRSMSHRVSAWFTEILVVAQVAIAGLVCIGKVACGRADVPLRPAKVGSVTAAGGYFLCVCL